eukprot:GHVL01038384.1.p2 GENE.GHVL01038384.1~~GHVL01038384.1.p2  ORF type:complete len:103 (-),score=11.60 GHVL01038384.1:726-1034(-)
MRVLHNDSRSSSVGVPIRISLISDELLIHLVTSFEPIASQTPSLARMSRPEPDGKKYLSSGTAETTPGGCLYLISKSPIVLEGSRIPQMRPFISSPLLFLNK